MKNIMVRLVFCTVLTVLLLCVAGVARAQDKANEQVLKELAELRAEVKVLQARLAKLEGQGGGTTISENDKKWMRNLADDFMKEMIRPRTDSFDTLKSRAEAVKSFVAPGVQIDRVQDRNVEISFFGGNRFPRWCHMDFVFNHYQIDSEELAPRMDEVLLRGKLSGNRGEFTYNENASRVSITKGKLGPRTGVFTMRISRDKDAMRWTISHFAWTIDEIKKDPEKSPGKS